MFFFKVVVLSRSQAAEASIASASKRNPAPSRIMYPAVRAE